MFIFAIMSNNKDIKVFMPQPGFQEKFVRSNVDVVIGGGSLNVGKSFAACLMIAEWVLNPDFRAVFTRRNLDETKKGGSLLDDLKHIYGSLVKVKESDSPRVKFPSGAFVDLTHISKEEPEALMERVKGWQYDCVYMDEGTSYSWNTFKTILTRNRGKAGIGSKIRITTNPKRTHWLRIFIDWWIGDDGYIRKDRDGVVRYFYLNGERVEDVVWGRTKEEVYKKCQKPIDSLLSKIKDGSVKFTYENFIKSCVFYGGSISENIASIGENKDYIGSIAASGTTNAEQLLGGNWNVDPLEDTEIPLPRNIVEKVFEIDPQVNGDRWITVDLADYGTDNMVAYAWNGFHIIDMIILSKSTPRQNAQRVLQLAEKNDVGEANIIYDATSARYLNDYIPDAIPYISGAQSRGLYRLQSARLKDCCYMRLVHMIKNGLLSIDEQIEKSPYYHQKLSTPTTFKQEFIEECSVVQFQKLGSGKHQLLTKREMNAKLGKSRSMDVLDPMAMRMLPILNLEYGNELMGSVNSLNINNENDDFSSRVNVDIYDDTFWA